MYKNKEKKRQSDREKELCKVMGRIKIVFIVCSWILAMGISFTGGGVFVRGILEHDPDLALVGIFVIPAAWWLIGLPNKLIHE